LESRKLARTKGSTPLRASQARYCASRSCFERDVRTGGRESFKRSYEVVTVGPSGLSDTTTSAARPFPVVAERERAVALARQ
jgi:hypothetical protein